MLLDLIMRPATTAPSSIPDSTPSSHHQMHLLMRSITTAPSSIPGSAPSRPPPSPPRCRWNREKLSRPLQGRARPASRDSSQSPLRKVVGNDREGRLLILGISPVLFSSSVSKVSSTGPWAAIGSRVSSCKTPPLPPYLLLGNNKSITAPHTIFTAFTLRRIYPQ